MCIRYARVEADDGKVFDFYNNINLVEGIRFPEAGNNAAPRQDDQNDVPSIKEGEYFEAYNCFFKSEKQLDQIWLTLLCWSATTKQKSSMNLVPSSCSIMCLFQIKSMSIYQ